MKKQATFLEHPAAFMFFHQKPFAEFVPNVRCVSKLGVSDELFPEKGRCHFFTVYFDARQPMHFCFGNERTTVTARRDLIARMMTHFGADQVIFTNGFYSDVAVAEVLEDVTDIYAKDGRFVFSAMLTDMALTLHFGFGGMAAAVRCHAALANKIEARRLQATAKSVRIAIGV